MKLSARSTAFLLPLLLTGCIFHRHQQTQNQQLAPRLTQPPNSPGLHPTPVDLPPSATTIPTQPTENAKAPTEQEPQPRRRRHNPRPSKPAPAEDTTENTAPPAVSAIGQLSSGDPVDYRQETEGSIVAVEKGLNGINRSLNDTEQKTADHIREFIKQARAALATGDVDGAHTLAAKAKVLLAELTQ